MANLALQRWEERKKELEESGQQSTSSQDTGGESNLALKRWAERKQELQAEQQEQNRQEIGVKEYDEPFTAQIDAYQRHQAAQNPELPGFFPDFLTDYLKRNRESGANDSDDTYYQRSQQASKNSTLEPKRTYKDLDDRYYYEDQARREKQEQQNQAKKAEQFQEQQKILEKRQRDAVEFTRAPYANPIRYDQIESMQDYEAMVEKGRQNPRNRFRETPMSFIEALDPRNWEYQRGATEGLFKPYRNLTDTERNRYNYILGAAGEEAADTYLESLKDPLARESAAKTYSQISKLPKPVAGAAKTGASFAAGLDSAMRGLGTLPALITGQEVENHNTELEYLQSYINERSKGLPNVLYQAAGAIGGMAPSIAAGALTGGSSLAAQGITQSSVFAAQAAGQTYRQDLQEGRPVEGAQASALLAAADEAVTNWLLNGVSQFGGGALKQAMGNSRVAQAARQGITGAMARHPNVRRAVLSAADYGADMLSEASQEGLQNITESMRNTMVYGDDFDLMENLENPETWEAALVGGITAGIMNAPGVMAQEYALNRYGSTIDQDYREYASSLDPNRGNYAAEADYQEAMSLRSLAEEYAARQGRGESIPNRDKAEYDIRLNRLQESMMANDPRYQDEVEAYWSGRQEGTGEAQQAEMRQEAEETMQPYPAQEISEWKPETAQEQPGMVQVQQNTIQQKNIREMAQDELDAVRMWSREFESNGQKAFESNYDGETDLTTYYRAFGRVYNAGRYGFDLTADQQAEAAVVLSQEAFDAALKAGYQDLNANRGYDVATGRPFGAVQGQPKNGGIGSVSDSATQAQRQVASHVGKLTGLTIDLVDSLETEGATASYQPGRITIDINSQDFNASMAHELTHFIKEQAPSGYEVFEKHVVQAMTNATGMDLESSLQDVINRYRDAGKNLNRAQAMEELVADSTQRFMNDPEFIEQVIKDDRSLGQKIIDYFADVIDALKELIRTGSTRASARALEEQMEIYERARDNWYAMLEEASENYKSGQEVAGEEKNRIEHPDQVTDERIEQNFETVRKMEPVVNLKGDEFGKGERSLKDRVIEFYEQIGKVHNETVGDIYLTKDSVKDDLAHGVGRVKAITFAAVPDILQKGKVLKYSKNWKNRGYDSVIIGAPIHIAEGNNAGDYYGLAVVKVMEDNRMYLHEVFTAKMGDVTPIKTPDFQGSNTRSDAYDLPSIYSIFGKLLNVNESKADNVKFQLEEVEDEGQLIRNLQKENKHLREANESLKKQFKLTKGDTLRQDDIKKVAGNLLKDYGSKYKRETLERNLTKLYDYIRSADNVDPDVVNELANGIAKSILNNAQQIDQEQSEQYKDLRKQLRNTKVKIEAQDKADLAAAGGYTEFRKKYFGKLRLGNDGISIDSFYQELNSQYPELFPAEFTHPADQLMAVANAVDQIQERVVNPYHANMDEMAVLLGSEIKEAYYTVRNAPPTFADRKAAELEGARVAYKRSMDRYKAFLRKQYESGAKNAKQAIINERDKIKTARNALLEQIADGGMNPEEKKDAKREEKELRERLTDLNRQLAQVKYIAQPDEYVENMRQIRERRQRNRDKETVLRDVKSMQTWLLQPNKQKHVPEELKGIVMEFLRSIDYSTDYLNKNGEKTARTEAWDDLQNFWNAVKDGNEWNGQYYDGDPDIASRLTDLKAKVKGIERLDDLSPADMSNLRRVVSSMKKTIMEVNELKANQKAQEVEALGGAVIHDLDDISQERWKTQEGKDEAIKGRSEFVGPLGTADKLLNYDSLTPYTVFWKMGNNMLSLYQSFRKAADRKTTQLKEADDYVKKAVEDLGLTRKEINEWTGKNAKARTFKTSGGEISLTPAMVMSLYVTNKRGQGRKHIYGDGIKNAPILSKQQKDGKGGWLPSKVQRAYRPVRVTPGDVEAITNSLSQKQKDFADRMQQFLMLNAADWGNEASLLMYGYKKFMSRDYWPILTDQNYIYSAEGDLSNLFLTVRNFGMTKPVTRFANNAVIIDDIFDVFSRHVDQMSTYSTFLAPLSDFNKVYNYKNSENLVSVKQEIERAMGTKGKDYLERLIRDINGGERRDSTFLDSMLSNAKGAAVAGSLSVAIQQPSAYLRAAAEINPKYLAEGVFTAPTKQLWNRICKYAPIAQWKDWGFYQMNTSRPLKDILFDTDSLKNRINNVAMMGAQKADQMTWSWIWKACENEIKDTHKELEPGTESFYRQVGDRFSEIIDKTQVVDSVLHRTQIMRSKDFGVKAATAFMGEPLSTYNMLYRAGVDVQRRNKGAKARAAGVAAAFVATNALGAALKSIISALRDDDEDKNYWQKYVAAFWGLDGNFADSINPIGMLPLGKDIMSIVQGYEPSRMELQGYADLWAMIQRITKLSAGESKETSAKVVADAAGIIGNLFGLPVKNVLRDADALFTTAIQSTSSLKDDYTRAKSRYDIANEDNRSRYAKYIVQAEEAGNMELASQIYSDLEESGQDPEKIENSINNIITKQYKEDELVMAAAEAKADNDLKGYGEAFESLIEAGYNAKRLKSAINSLETEIYKERGEENPRDRKEEPAEEEEDDAEEQVSAYESKDLIWAIEQANDNVPGAKEQYNAIVTEIYETKIANGMEPKKAIQSLRTTISNAFKPRWQAAEGKEKDEILIMVKNLKVNDRYIFSGYDFNNWKKKKE